MDVDLAMKTQAMLLLMMHFAMLAENPSWFVK